MLKSQLIAYRKRTPYCLMSINSDRGTSFKTMGEVAMLMQQAGFGDIGFLTEPDNVR